MATVSEKIKPLQRVRSVLGGLTGPGMIIKYVLPLIAIGLLVFAIQYVTSRRGEQPPPKPLVEPATAPFAETVAAAGIVEPQSEDIQVGSPQPGIVVEVFVKVGDHVLPGSPLFRLDDRPLTAEMLVRRAAREAARAEVLRLEKRPRPEEVKVNDAQVREAEENVLDKKDQFQRAQDLRQRNVVSEEEFTTRRQAYRMAEAQLAKATAERTLLKAGSWQYDLEVAQAAVTQADAQLKAIQTDLERLHIRSLVEGQVLQVNVRPGEFVGTPPNQPLIILGSVNQLYVRADIDEHDIPRFIPHNKATAVVRGDPKQEIPLTFVRVEPYVVPKKSLTGQNTERVDTRVLQVIYALGATDQSIYVGQQLDVFVDASPPAVETASRQ